MTKDYELYEPYKYWDPFIERDDKNGVPNGRQRSASGGESGAAPSTPY